MVNNLEVKYAPELPAVLHDLSFTVRPAEKIGVVRRIPLLSFLYLIGFYFRLDELAQVSAKKSTFRTVMF